MITLSITGRRRTLPFLIGGWVDVYPAISAIAAVTSMLSAKRYGLQSFIAGVQSNEQHALENQSLDASDHLSFLPAASKSVNFSLEHAKLRLS